MASALTVTKACVPGCACGCGCGSVAACRWRWCMRVSHAARRCRWTRVNPTLLVGAHRKRPKSKLERGCDDESFSVSGCPRCHGGGDGVGSRARVFMTTRGLARVVCLRGFNVARRCRWAVRAHRQRPKSNSEDGCDDGGSSASLQRRIFPYLTTQMPRARGVSASPKRPFAFLIHIRTSTKPSPASSSFDRTH